MSNTYKEIRHYYLFLGLSIILYLPLMLFEQFINFLLLYLTLGKNDFPFIYFVYLNWHSYFSQAVRSYHMQFAPQQSFICFSITRGHIQNNGFFSFGISACLKVVTLEYSRETTNVVRGIPEYFSYSPSDFKTCHAWHMCWPVFDSAAHFGNRCCLQLSTPHHNLLDLFITTQSEGTTSAVSSLLTDFFFCAVVVFRNFGHGA